MSYLDGWKESAPSNLSAVEALIQAKANALKLEEKRKQKEIEEKKIAESKQRCEDDVWFTQATDSAKIIIKYLVDNGKFGFKNAKYGHWFNNDISDRIVEKFKKHYIDLGYGCEVKKPYWPEDTVKDGYVYPAQTKLKGHICLWIPDPDELEEKEKNNEISW